MTRPPRNRILGGEHLGRPRIVEPSAGETEHLDERTPLVDPGSEPRFRKRGEAAREPAIFDEQPIGPLRGHVVVTPIRRLDRDTYFELRAEWGPDEDGGKVAGLRGLPSHHVVDMAAIGEAEAARRLARAAVDRLRVAEKRDRGRCALDLTELARELGVPLLDRY